MVVTKVQDYIAAGQFRGGERLIDVQNTARPGTTVVFLDRFIREGLERNRRNQEHGQSLYQHPRADFSVLDFMPSMPSDLCTPREEDRRGLSSEERPAGSVSSHMPVGRMSKA
jgi:hypothetical protein